MCACSFSLTIKYVGLTRLLMPDLVEPGVSLNGDGLIPRTFIM